MLVPVHLAEDLPGPGALAELVEIGLAVRIAADSTMCLSGSAALLNALEHVGDLDFCEYAELLDPRRAVEVATAVDVHASRLATPICQRAQLAGTPPLDVSCHDGWNAAARLAIEHGVESGVRYVKLDFVARSAVVGVVEATNVVLLLDAGRPATLARSFAGQEVPVGTADAILPRPLCDPMSIGHYINFLRDQIGKYAAKQPVEALKRGLSLARMMFLDTSGESILDLLRDPQGALQAAIDARHALVVKLERAHCPSHTRRAVLEELRSELEPWIADLRIAAAAKPWRVDWASEAQSSLKMIDV